MPSERRADPQLERFSFHCLHGGLEIPAFSSWDLFSVALDVSELAASRGGSSAAWREAVQTIQQKRLRQITTESGPLVEEIIRELEVGSSKPGPRPKQATPEQNDLILKLRRRSMGYQSIAKRVEGIGWRRVQAICEHNGV